MGFSTYFTNAASNFSSGVGVGVGVGLGGISSGPLTQLVMTSAQMAVAIIIKKCFLIMITI
jgi:hypothetical protein